MITRPVRPGPLDWAYKLREAAADLRMKAGRSADQLSLAGRLERYAEAILFPQLPRWWTDPRRHEPAILHQGGDD